MRQSLSNPTDAFAAPNSQEHAVGSIKERDHIWDQLTQDQYAAYYRMAWNIAYLIVGHPLEADIVADKVMVELETRAHPPLPSEIETHLRILARSRALDCLASPMHRFRMNCRSLLLQAEEEEYESLPEAQCSIGAEEEFFYEEDRELFAHQFAQAMSRLNDLQRACFILRFVEHIKPEEIAEILQVPVDTVYTQTYRARNRVAKLLTNRRNIQATAKERKEVSLQTGSALVTENRN